MWTHRKPAHPPPGRETPIRPMSNLHRPVQVVSSRNRNNIATCANAYVRRGDSYSVETGNMVGPTKTGVQAVIGNPPTDTWVSVGHGRNRT